MLFFIIQNPKMLDLLMLKNFKLKKIKGEFCAQKSKKNSIVSYCVPTTFPLHFSGMYPWPQYGGRASIYHLSWSQ